MKPFSLILIIFGIYLIGSYIIYDNAIKKINSTVVNDYFDKPKVIKEEVDNIIGVLHIPKINFKMGFYNYNSKNNNVDKNIALLNNNLPDSKNSVMIIAAHSGNSYLGYFKNIDKLNMDDKIEIFYNNKKYLYFVSDIYLEEKNGKISYNRNINEQILILTTCSKNNKQLIIVAKLYKICDN